MNSTPTPGSSPLAMLCRALSRALTNPSSGMLPIAALCFAVCFQPAARADEYDTLRERWKTTLNGGTAFDPADPDIAAAITRITNDATTYWNTMDTSPSRTWLWSDLPDGSDSNFLVIAYSRLATMATAYATSGSSLQGSASLRTDLISALDWMYANRYSENETRYGNWFHWEIAVPTRLNNITILLYADSARPNAPTT